MVYFGVNFNNFKNDINFMLNSFNLNNFIIIEFIIKIVVFNFGDSFFVIDVV